MTKSDLVFGLALLDYLKETQPKTISKEQLKEIKNEVRLLVDKQQKKYENIVDKYSNLQDKYIKQKDNWDKLKKYLKNEGLTVYTREYGAFDAISKDVIFEIIQKLEQGSK